jgi:hypothetical protein
VNFDRAADGLGPGFRQAEKTHLASGNQVTHRADGLLDGHLRVNPVLVVKVNHLQPEPLQAGIAGRADVFGPAIDAEKRAGGVADVAELRCQHDLAAPVTNGLADQRLVGAQAVHVRRIQEG